MKCNDFVRRPQSLLNGMNRFLESLEITFRRDPNNFRPRINKMNSVKVILKCFATNLLQSISQLPKNIRDIYYFLNVYNVGRHPYQNLF